ncbi:MAG: serine/threonine-protein kinase [Deltaproteobacteria bacterium]
MGVFPEPRPEKFGRYILLDRINVGGMAEVFRGKSSGVEGFERLVALKRILPNIAADQDFIDMFVDEAKLAVQLQHANIAQVYDLGKQDETYYIAMEYISGVDLRSMWDRARNRNRLLPIAMSCHIMQKVCEGLDAAHRKKDQEGNDISLVHRDVSPQNVLVSFEGEAKVIDFGIARAANKVSKTQAGVLKGKFGYMSPEQVRGIELDNRSDIFACGVVLYELLVGDRLFLGESDFSTLEKVRNVELVPPTRLNKNLSPHLERIVMKALAKNREDRYRWASEMAEDLQRYLFATNQPFARTDLQRYMQQHFKEEMEKERQRLDRYKTIHYADFDEPAPNPAPRATSGRGDIPTEVSTGLQEQVMQPQARFPSALNAAPMNLQQPSMDQLPRQPSLQMPPPPQTPQKSGLPTWAAVLIGALSVLLLVAIVGIVYLNVAKPKPGAVTIESTPANAEVLLNGKVVANKTPLTLDNLEPSTYVLTVQAEGYETVIRPVTIEDGEARIETIELKKEVGSSSVILRTKPPGLKVIVDGRDTKQQTPATVTGLAAGKHQFILQRDDGTIVHRVRMDLAEGAAEVMEVDTRNLQPLLDVASVPSGAALRVDGKLKGTTPVTVAGLRPGRARIQLEHDGCAKHEQTIELERATVVPLEITLSCGGKTFDEEGSADGRMDVTATVVADVFVDGVRVGRTPVMGIAVPRGRRKLKLVPVGAQKPPYVTEVVVGEGVRSFHHQF